MDRDASHQYIKSIFSIFLHQIRSIRLYDASWCILRYFSRIKNQFFFYFFFIFLYQIRPVREYDASWLTFVMTLPANKIDRSFFDFHISRSRFRLIIRPSGTNEEPVCNSFPLCTDCHFLSLTEIVLLVDGLLGSVIGYYLMEKEIKMNDCYNIFLSYHRYILLNKKCLLLLLLFLFFLV